MGRELSWDVEGRAAREVVESVALDVVGGAARDVVGNVARDVVRKVAREGEGVDLRGRRSH